MLILNKRGIYPPHVMRLNIKGARQMEIYNEFVKLRGNGFTTSEYVFWLELQVLKLRAALKLAEAGRITGGQAVASEVCPYCKGNGGAPRPAAN